MIEALNKYSQTKLDFVDCLLYGYSQVHEIEIMTFDKKLKTEIEINSEENNLIEDL